MRLVIELDATAIEIIEKLKAINDAEDMLGLYPLSYNFEWDAERKSTAEDFTDCITDLITDEHYDNLLQQLELHNKLIKDK